MGEKSAPSRLRTAYLELAMRRPRLVILGALLLTLVLGALIVRVDVDTDPENMLRSEDPARVLNESLRDDFGTRETLMLGVVDPTGALSAATLSAGAELVEEIKRLDGTVAGGVLSFTSIGQMPEVPLSDGETATVLEAVAAQPLLADRVISEDASAFSVFVPLETKGDANDVAASIERLLEESTLREAEHHLAGLPLAEEAFGRDMFIQMGILAPLAGLLIFALMLYLFRRLALVAAAMVVAMLSVIWTMGLLIGTGFSLHIMSSMIPIFLMPIAILDSVHVLSELFDRYPRYGDRRETLRAVYRDLFRPITYTSLTTAVAFASLTIAPIPPVQVFGAFVAVGVFFAWLLTMVFLPAFVMLLSEQSLERIRASSEGRGNRALARGVRGIGQLAIGHGRWIVAAFAVLVIVAIPAITQITVNDNPVRWFKQGSEIRTATEQLSERFAGTYNASLLLRSERPGALTQPETLAALANLQSFWDEIDVVGATTSYADLVGPGGQESIEAQLASPSDPVGRLLAPSLITPELERANVQLQLSDGDNQAMQRVIDRTAGYLAQQPLPSGIGLEWAGETYLNLVWQDKMVTGMLQAFLSTLGVVFLLLVLLFRSLRWALLAIVPLATTVLLVYGAIGLVGKSYDMPIAVLSTLVLGIGIDFAIHFSERYRALRRASGSTREALERFFDEPARALTRNALIIAVGFLPLFLSSLVPYLVVGTFLAAIMVLSWLATLLLLPGLLTLGETLRLRRELTAIEQEGAR